MLKIARKLLIFSCFMGGYRLVAFASLKELVAYAEKIEESVIPKNHDFLNPDFSHFYRSRTDSFLTTIKNFIFRKHNVDIVATCLSLLKQLIIFRELQGYGYRHVAQLFQKTNDKLIVLTDLQGAFHSLVRSLSELHRKGIISDDFIIQKNDYYLIFNANIVGVSHVNIELLLVIILLMIKNPDQVIYILGPHEDRDLWLDQGVMTELEALLGLQGFSINPQGSSRILKEFRFALERFFDTLPLALYIDYPIGSPETHNLIKISGINTPELNETQYDDFFNDKNSYEGVSPLLRTYRLENKIPSPQRNLVRASIVSIGRAIDFQKTAGLLQIDPKNGTTVWSVFSGPSIFNRAINDFFYDSFVVVNLKDRIDDVTIDLFNRDIRIENKFKKETSYSIVSGIEIHDGITDRQSNLKQIIIGASTDLSRWQGMIGRLIRDGSIAYTIPANHNLILGDATLHIAFFDDRSSPQQALQNVQDIQQEYGTSTICFTINAASAYDLRDKVKSNDILLLFPLISSTQWHQESYSGVIFLRPSLRNEIRTLGDYAIKNYPERKFCCLYEEDEFGHSALEAFKKSLTKHGINDLLAISHLRGATNFKSQINSFKKNKCDVLFLCTNALAAYEFIQQLGVEHLYNVDLYGISMLSSPHFRNFLKDRGLNMICTHVVPNPITSTLPIVQSYREHMDQQNKPYDTFSLEGYIATALLIDALKHIKGPATHTALLSHFTSLQNYSWEGITLSFNPYSRDLMKTIWLETTNAVEWQPFVYESEELS